MDLTRKPIILWGATGQARVLAEFLPALGWQIVALFDNDRSLTSPFSDVPLVGGEGDLVPWLATQSTRPAALIALGGGRGRDRLNLQDRLTQLGCPIPVAQHPAAYLSPKAVVGAGSQILAGSVIATEVNLGRSVIINTRAAVDHECQLGHGVHVAPGATLCGLVSVGDCSFLGAGCTVLPRIRIGSGTIVGAGSVVTRDLPDNVIAYGVPARIIRARRDTDTTNHARSQGS